MELEFSYDKEKLLAELEKQTYAERWKYAATLGTKNTRDARLIPFLKELIEHPSSAVDADVQTADEIAPTLPGQQRETSKNFMAYQFGIVALAHSKNGLEILKRELQSPTKWMKQFIVNEVVKNERNDETLVNLIKNSVQFTRKLLLRAVLAESRTSVLDSVIDYLESECGVPTAAAVLHGCSKAVIEKRLQDNRYHECQALHVKHLIKLHGEIIIKLMRQQLNAEPNPLSRCSIWNKWSDYLNEHRAMKLFLMQHNLSKQLMQLLEEYPCYVAEPTVKLEETQKATVLPDGKPSVPARLTFPSWIKEHYKYFIVKHPDEFFEYAKRGFYVSGGVHWIDDVSILWYAIMDHERAPFAKRFSLLETIFSMSSIHTLAYSSSLDVIYMTRRDMYMPTRISCNQALKMGKLMLDTLKRIAPHSGNSEERKRWYNAARDLRKKLSSIANNIINNKRITEAKSVDVAVVTDLLRFAWIEVTETIRSIITEWQSMNEFRAMVDELYLVTHVPHVADEFYTTFVEPCLNMQSHDDVEQTNLMEYFDKFCDTIKGFSNPANILDENMKQISRELSNKMFDKCIEAIAAAPIKYASKASRLLDTMQHLNAEDSGKNAKKIWQLYNTNQRIFLLNQSHSLMTPLLIKLPVSFAAEEAKALLANASLKKAGKEILNPFLDISDPKTRQQLQKACDSNSPADRLAAIQALVASTVKNGSPKEMVKTLKFLRAKMKNEAQQRRASILSNLVSQCKRKNPILITASTETGSASDIWLEMLQDALESPDLDTEESGGAEFRQHPILKHFHKLSVKALAASVDIPELLEFGVEIQWRILLFRKGRSRASVEYYIDLDKKQQKIREALKNKENINEVVEYLDRVLNAYRTRIAEMNPDWESHFKYKALLFNIAWSRWPEVPVLAKYVEDMLNHDLENTPKDKDGLFIYDEGDYDDMDNMDVVKLFKKLKRAHDDWTEVPLLKRIFEEFLLKSRLLPVYLNEWVSQLTKQAGKNQRKRKAALQQLALQLIELTPSAIHLRFVRNYIYRYRQDLLNKFIETPASFRGPFYVPKRESSSALTLSTSSVRQNYRVTRFTGARKRVPKITHAYRKRDKFPTKLEFTWEEEMQAEKEMLDEMQNSEIEDHRDLFLLEYTYGLHRLTPRQVSLIAERWKNQILNTNRPIPERVHAAIRWTLMPTVSYLDIIRFSKEHPELPVNIQEVLIKGMFNNDEPCAPLNYLFSPSFLASSQAHLAMYASEKCLKYMQPGTMTQALEECVFAHNKRKEMKITTMKQAIRMLLSQPTDENVKLIYREWTKRDMHRDVRITILQTAFGLLRRSGGKYAPIAWKIFEFAAKPQNHTEVLLALLGISVCPVASRNDLFQRPRLSQFLSSFTSITLVTKEERRKWARLVVFPLATIKTDDPNQPTVDEDVKHIATAILAHWGTDKELTAEATKILSEAEAAYWDKSIDKNLLAFDRKLNFKRWQHTIRQLAQVCGLSKKSKSPSPDTYINIINRIVTQLKTPEIWNDIELRPMHIAAIQHCLLKELPEVYSKCYSKEVEEKLMTPIKTLGGLFKAQLLLREFANTQATDTDVIADILHQIVCMANSDPTPENIEHAEQCIKKAIDKAKGQILRKLIDLQLGPIPEPDRYYTSIIDEVVLEQLYRSNFSVDILKLVKRLIQSPQLPNYEYRLKQIITKHCGTYPDREDTLLMPGESERKLVEYIVQVFTDRLHGEKTPQWNFAVSFIKSQPETILSTMPGRVCELAHQLIVEADGASFLEHLLSRFVKFGCHQTLFNAVLSGELPTSDPLNGLQFAYYTCIPQSEPPTQQQYMDVIMKIYDPAKYKITKEQLLQFAKAGITHGIIHPAWPGWVELVRMIIKFIKAQYETTKGPDTKTLRPTDVEIIHDLIDCKFTGVAHPFTLTEATDDDIKLRTGRVVLEVVKQLGSTFEVREKDDRVASWSPVLVEIVNKLVASPVENIREDAAKLIVSSYPWKWITE